MLNKLVVPFGILVLCMCAGAWLRTSGLDSSIHHEARWFSKAGHDCAMVRFNDSLGEWNVYSGDTSIFPKEKDALAFARNACGGGDDLKTASARHLDTP